jgi:uncharacterized protein (UPF0276 family)
LGANGTEAMTALLSDGGVGLVDYLKVGPFMGRPAIASLARGYPLLLHLDDTLSNHVPLSAERMAGILDLVALTATPWTSEHIGFSVADTDLDGALITQAASDLLPRETAMENIIRNARALAEQLPVPLLLENIPLFPNLAHIHVCEPDFVAEVIAETGCGLLLDLAHARVSADVLGCSVRDYLAQLPLERAVEFHLSGPRPLGALDARRQTLVRQNAKSVAHLHSFGEHNLVDAHAPMQEEDYALLTWALARCEPKAISLEYYYDPEELRQQLERLNEMLGRRA